MPQPIRREDLERIRGRVAIAIGRTWEAERKLRNVLGRNEEEEKALRAAFGVLNAQREHLKEALEEFSRLGVWSSAVERAARIGEESKEEAAE